MRIYTDCREMYSEEQRNLVEMGIRVHPQTMQDRDVRDDPAYATIELSPCVFTILDGSDRDQWIRDLKLPLDWAVNDFQERIISTRLRNLPGVNPGEAWRMRADVWKPFLHNGRFAYTYSERFGRHVSGEGALMRVINELKRNPDTRQAVLPMFDCYADLPNLGGIARVPCTLGYQFLRRREQLDLFYMMRSTDFKTHFPLDIWMALELQSFVASCLDCERGRFTFFSGSLHLYAKDADPGVF